MMRRIRDTTRALPRRALMRGVTAGSIAAYLGGAASGPAKVAEEHRFRRIRGGNLCSSIT